MWSVLTTTERWICQNISRCAAQTPGIKKGRNTNKKKEQQQKEDYEDKQYPFSRKEVYYVCETSHECSLSFVASIFRNIKEAREIGEVHGQHEYEYEYGPGHDQDQDQDHNDNQDHNHNRQQRKTTSSSSLRQTVIVVIPAKMQSGTTIFTSLMQYRI